jgi:hypothetical protein
MPRGSTARTAPRRSAGRDAKKEVGRKFRPLVFDQRPLQDTTWGITTGRDGAIYVCLCGEFTGTRNLRDLGIPMATSERYWHGYEFGAAVTGRFGEIYLGESDRISHLFIYHPAAKPRATAVPTMETL